MNNGIHIRGGFDPAELLSPGLSYDQAVKRLVADGRVIYLLRQRMKEDAERDPLKALHEAQALVALAQLRLSEPKQDTGEQQ